MKLITGATGFLGSYFIWYLVDKGYQVRALKRPESSFEQIKIAFDTLNRDASFTYDDFISRIDWVDADITSYSGLKKSLNGIDEVYHLAAIVSFKRKDRKDIEDINVRSTQNLVNLCLEFNIEKLHFASSIASLNRNEQNIITEKNDISDKRFSTAYSKSKFLAEMEVWRGYEEGLKGVIINPGVILGPVVHRHDSIRAFKTIQKGFGFYPRGRNGYVDVRDTAEIFLRLSEDDNFYNDRYLLVSESVSYKDLFGWMSEDFGIKGPRKRASRRLSYLIAYLDAMRSFVSGTNPMITTDLVKLVNSDYFFDNSKILNALNYEFKPIRETVKDVCEFLKSNHK